MMLPIFPDILDKWIPPLAGHLKCLVTVDSWEGGSLQGLSNIGLMHQRTKGQSPAVSSQPHMSEGVGKKG